MTVRGIYFEIYPGIGPGDPQVLSRIHPMISPSNHLSLPPSMLPDISPGVSLRMFSMISYKISSAIISGILLEILPRGFFRDSSTDLTREISKDSF